MAFRTVVINNPAYLSTAHNQMVIEQEDKITLPIEDVNTVLINNTRSTVTTGLLNKFADSNVAFFVCNDKFMPSGVFLPFAKYSRISQIFKLQLAQTEPFKKQLWKEIIKRKILNQALALKFCGNIEFEKLITIANSVNSGDTNNREAYAANLYFKMLYNDLDRKDENNKINSALNYGYVVIRGMIARSLVAYGFQPYIGIHHANELNQFNLADDLIEPFRPFVDYWVAHNPPISDNLDKEYKQQLIDLVNYKIEIAGQKQSVFRAIEISVASCQAALRHKDVRKLTLPVLVPLQRHNYE